MDRWTDVFERNKKWLILALVSTFFWGMLAHGYSFFDISVSHDSLNELHSGIVGNQLKMGSGRVLIALYRDIFRSDVTMPWLIGMLSLIWLGLAVFLVLRLFRIESRLLAFLTAGIMTANISLSATAATYIQDLDCNMFTLLCVTTAVYLWRNYKWGWLAGGILFTIALSIYQSMLFAGVAMVMMLCILDLLEGKAFSQVFFPGIRAIGMVILGGIGYLLLMKVFFAITGLALSTGEYNSLDSITRLTPATIPLLILQTYWDWFYRLMNAYTSYPYLLVKAITLVLFALFGLVVVFALCSRKLRWAEKGLLAALLALFPLGSNMIYVLLRGASHDLTAYAIWLFYLLVLLMLRWLEQNWCPKRKILKTLCTPAAMVLIAMLLYGNVQFSNGMYLKKDLEYDAYLSAMNRIVYRMEDMEGYEPGVTPVVLCGLPEILNDYAPGFKDYWNVTGMQFTDVIYMTERTRYRAYINYIMALPLKMADSPTWYRLLNSEEVAGMPAYPAEGCVAFIDDVLVVKMETSE